jgi:hypothetical protein
MADSIVISIQRLLKWNEAIEASNASDSNEVFEALDMIVSYYDAIRDYLIKEHHDLIL